MKIIFIHSNNSKLMAQVNWRLRIVNTGYHPKMDYLTTDPVEIKGDFINKFPDGSFMKMTLKENDYVLNVDVEGVDYETLPRHLSVRQGLLLLLLKYFNDNSKKLVVYSHETPRFEKIKL